jgi:hypothetical protein
VSLFGDTEIERRKLAEKRDEKPGSCPPEVLARLMPLDAETDQMKVRDFNEQALYVRVWSAVFNEWIVLASDDAVLPDTGPLVVYRASEFPALLSLKGNLYAVRSTHEAKRLFGGLISAKSGHTITETKRRV